MRSSTVILLGTLTGMAGLIGVACNGGGNPGPVAGVVNVSGVAEDWRSGVPLPGAIVRTQLISPPRSTVADQSGHFTLSNVPIDGYLILDVASAMSPAAHMETYSPAFLVAESDLAGIIAPGLSAQDAAQFTNGFGIQTTSGRGVILGRVLSAGGGSLAGVSQFQTLPLGFAVSGPDFLDATDSVPGTRLPATSTGGGFLYFNVTGGNVSVDANASGYSFQPAATISAPGVWSLVDLTSTGAAGPTPTPAVCVTPTGVKFGGQVIPIFQHAPPQGAGCATSGMCHGLFNNTPPASGFVLGGMGPGTDPKSIYAHIMMPAVTPSPPFANVGTAGESQLLLRPTQVLTHPQQILKSPALGFCEPFYLTIYGWIAEGAPNN